jgi:hypothetical protein
VYYNPALAGALVRDRVAQLQQSAGATAHPRPRQRRPNVIAAARLGAGWLLIDMGLRLAMPRGGTDRPVTGGQR